MLRRLSLIPLVLSLACTDYNLSGKPPGEGRPDSGSPPETGDPGSDDCSVEEPPPGDVGVDDSCLAPDLEITDPWNVAIEWQYTVTSGTGSIVMPAIGNLTDDNHDGVVDQHDSPDIVITTWGSNTLVALHGDGSGVIFETAGFDGNAGVAIADVDGDGFPEIIAGTTDKRVAAVDATGTIEWRSNAFSWQQYPQPAVGDLDGDGDIEIVFDIAVVEGASGATVTTLSGITSSWRAPVIADIDVDGDQEILLGEHVYAPDGSIEWSVTRSGDSTFAAVADIDGDPGGETFWVTGAVLIIVDDDGSVIRSVPLNSGSSRPGPPSVADFDGDGDVEIAIPASQKLEVFEVDGTRSWQASIQDNSGIAGASGYDIDGDGAYEVLYADEVSLRIFDGGTGAELYSNSSHSSATLWEYPVVADVDNDGSAEIVIASNGSVWKGLSVLGHRGDGWAKSGTTWPVHDFAMTNVAADGSVPSPAPRSWDLYNVFRARPTVDDAAVDLSVSIVDVCYAGCADDSVVKVAVQVANPGGLDSAAGLGLALYAVEDGAERLVATHTLADPVPTGWTSETVVFESTVGVVGTGDLRVRIDDDGAGNGVQNECDESNNTDTWSDGPC